MAKWEYKVVVRGRELRRSLTSRVTGAAVDDASVNGDFSPNGDEMLATLQALGQEEWELVGITTRASQLNSPLTTEEIWVFKRPIS